MSVDFNKALSQFETPFYIFDADELENQVSKIKQAVGSKARLCYAIKANPFLISSISKWVDNFEVCSPGEFHICEKLGIDIEKIILSGVYKNFDDIDYVVKKYGSQILYTAESFNQWQLLFDLAEKYDTSLNCLLRLSSGNQFGMDVSVIHEIMSAPSKVKVKGIHYFSGTQKKSPNKYDRELTMVKDLCLELAEKYKCLLPCIEYGPGLPVSYFPEENDIEETMLHALSSALSSLDYEGQITLEIGRYMAASCGHYLSSVVDTKINNGSPYCIIDGGIHHVNYFGQMMAMKKPPITKLCENQDDPCHDISEQEWTVCGSLCTANDVIVKQLPLSNLKVGDKLVFHKVGAYSVTEGITLLLSRDLPQVIICSDGNNFELIRGHEPTYNLNS